MLFLQGARDEFAELVLLRRVLRKLGLTTLHVAGRDHSFKFQTFGRSPEDVQADLSRWPGGSRFDEPLDSEDRPSTYSFAELQRGARGVGRRKPLALSTCARCNRVTTCSSTAPGTRRRSRHARVWAAYPDPREEPEPSSWISRPVRGSGARAHCRSSRRSASGPGARARTSLRRSATAVMETAAAAPPSCGGMTR
jgi:hypothetical protein